MGTRFAECGFALGCPQAGPRRALTATYPPPRLGSGLSRSRCPALALTLTAHGAAACSVPRLLCGESRAEDQSRSQPAAGVAAVAAAAAAAPTLRAARATRTARGATHASRCDGPRGNCIQLRTRTVSTVRIRRNLVLLYSGEPPEPPSQSSMYSRVRSRVKSSGIDICPG